jgi:hypothetical protein
MMRARDVTYRERGIAPDSVNPADVHMLAFKDGVVARLAVFAKATPAQHRKPGEALGGAGTGRPSIPETFVIKPMGRGVLDAPVKPAHDSGGSGYRVGETGALTPSS